MDKGPSETKKPWHETLNPVVVPIPDKAASSSVKSPKIPAAFERLLTNAVINKSTELLIEREAARTRIRQRIRGVLITDMRSALSNAEISEVFDFVYRSGELKAEEGLKWVATQMNLTLNNETFACRFLLSETKSFGLITVRFVKNSETPFNLTAWGMGPNQSSLLESFLGRSHGMVLFCGTDIDDIFPYIQATARQMATPERHVIAVGEQTQAWFPGVEQLSSSGDPELFSKMLKLAFRHEPDLVVVHPIEKKEHMDICLAEATRGRLVFGRVFATDVADSLMQLMSMGVEPYLIGAGLLGVVAQRTLRLNCQRCQDKDTVHRDRLKELGIPIGMQPTAFFQGKGCESCFKTGFGSETNIFEVLEMTDQLRSRLSRDMKADSVRSLLKTSGVMTLRQVALHKAINGQTSLSEVLRVTP